MTIEPLGTRLLIRPLAQEAATKSGILLPETAKEKPQQGLVEAVGSAEMATGLAVGDKVLFAKYTGNEIQMDGNTYLIMEENDVLARLKE